MISSFSDLWDRLTQTPDNPEEYALRVVSTRTEKSCGETNTPRKPDASRVLNGTEGPWEELRSLPEAYYRSLLD
jgi:hypothetical protein